MSRSDFGMTFWSAWCHRGHGPSRTRLLARLLGAEPAVSNCTDTVEGHAVRGLVSARQYRSSQVYWFCIRLTAVTKQISEAQCITWRQDVDITVSTTYSSRASLEVCKIDDHNLAIVQTKRYLISMFGKGAPFDFWRNPIPAVRT